jgi:hypothetical protein
MNNNFDPIDEGILCADCMRIVQNLKIRRFKNKYRQFWTVINPPGHPQYCSVHSKDVPIIPEDDFLTEDEFENDLLNYIDEQQFPGGLDG